MPMNKRKNQYALLVALWDEIEGMGSLIFSKVPESEGVEEDYQFYLAPPNKAGNNPRARRARLRIVQKKSRS